MTYFVKWNGDTDKDPFDRGIDCFSLYEEAFRFAQVLAKNKYATCIYSAQIMETKYQATLKDIYYG